MEILIQLQHLVDTHNNPFAVIDGHCRFVSVNNVFVDEFKIDRKDIIGKRLSDVISQFTIEDKNHVHKQILKMRRNSSGNLTCSNGNGSKKFIIKIWPIKSTGRSSYTGLTFKRFASIF